MRECIYTNRLRKTPLYTAIIVQMHNRTGTISTAKTPPTKLKEIPLVSAHDSYQQTSGC